jgi:hypothetical protein
VWFDAVLAEQAAKARDLIAQGRKVHVRRCPLLLAGVFLVEQLTLFVAQRRGRLEVLGVDGGFLITADLPDLLVQVADLLKAS